MITTYYITIASELLRFWASPKANVCVRVRVCVCVCVWLIWSASVLCFSTGCLFYGKCIIDIVCVLGSMYLPPDGVKKWLSRSQKQMLSTWMLTVFEAGFIDNHWTIQFTLIVHFSNQHDTVQSGCPRHCLKIQLQWNRYGEKAQLLTYFALNGLVIPSGPCIMKIDILKVLWIKPIIMWQVMMLVCSEDQQLYNSAYNLTISSCWTLKLSFSV